MGDDVIMSDDLIMGDDVIMGDNFITCTNKSLIILIIKTLAIHRLWCLPVFLMYEIYFSISFCTLGIVVWI